MIQPTPYPEINVVLAELIAGMQAILGENLLGVYLYGSLAAGDFNPESSDIDFAAVTHEPIAEVELSALQAMHARIAAIDSKWGYELEGSYFPKFSFRRHLTADARHPHLSRGGGLRVEFHDADWVLQRHFLRESGLTLYGPAPDTLIDPVSPDEIRRALAQLMENWWTPTLTDPARLDTPEYRAYAVLTMCRILFTLEHGTVASKPQAGSWALKFLDAGHSAAIHKALAWPADPHSADLEEALALIRHTTEESQQYLVDD